MNQPLMLAHGIVAGLTLSLLIPAGAAAQRTRYFAFGDSITSGLNTDEDCNCSDVTCQQQCGYPRRLRNRLRNAGFDVNVFNRGLGAERTAEGLTRLDDVLAEGGDVLLLMEGSNDISRNISPETTLANLEAMAQKATLAGFETVHATLIPRFPAARVDPENVTNAYVAGALRDLAFNEARQLVDPFEVFGAAPDVFNYLYSDIPNDPLGHPNAAGYSVLANVFLDVLVGTDSVPPVIGVVSPTDGSVDISPRTPISLLLYDFGQGLDSSGTEMLINDVPVAFTGSIGSHSQELIYEPANPLPTDVAVRIRGLDLLGQAMDREVSRFVTDPLAPGPCFADDTTLCIDRVEGDQRFQVTVSWQTALNGGGQGDAMAIPLTSIGLRRGGLFTFFDLQNPEILIKILDGCGINNHFWVFVAPTTNLGYDIRVVDTVAAQAGAPQSDYELLVSNVDGIDAPPVSDTSAFPTCSFAFP